MGQEKQSLYQRIRNARKSLENAEKSFQNDKDMRGELDLMLAEAELKNLRNKQAFPFNWNRNVLALGIAILLVIACFVGWILAKENRLPKDSRPIINTTNTELPQNSSSVSSVQKSKTSENIEPNGKKDSVKTQENTNNKVQLSDKDMRNLVRKAKSELNSSK